MRGQAIRRAAVLLLAMVAALVLVPGVNSAFGSPAPLAGGAGQMSGAERAFAGRVLRELNRERASAGREPLRMAPALVCSTYRHDERMARANKLTHQLPRELPFWRRMAQCGYRSNGSAENTGVNGEMSLHGVMVLQRMMWREHPPGETGHRRNILGPYRNVGIAVYLDRPHHKVWLTEDFGNRAG